MQTYFSTDTHQLFAPWLLLTMIQPTSVLVNLFFDILFLQVKKVTHNLAITCLLFG
jgi:hypothetical protein